MAEENGLELGEELGRIVPAKQKEADAQQVEEEHVRPPVPFYSCEDFVLILILGRALCTPRKAQVIERPLLVL